jgi:magnesium chelatase family protein
MNPAVTSFAGRNRQSTVAKDRLNGHRYHRILKVARTIADLTGAAGVQAAHVAEAIQYRRFDRSAN